MFIIVLYTLVSFLYVWPQLQTFKTAGPCKTVEDLTSGAAMSQALHQMWVCLCLLDIYSLADAFIQSNVYCFHCIFFYYTHDFDVARVMYYQLSCSVSLSRSFILDCVLHFSLALIFHSFFQVSITDLYLSLSVCEYFMTYIELWAVRISHITFNGFLIYIYIFCWINIQV